jgi:hypothetical protein
VQEVPSGPPDQVRRLERYRQEHPDVDIEPPGARSAVWRAFRDGDLIAYGFTLMVFLERLEALPEPLGAGRDADLVIPIGDAPVPVRAGQPCPPRGLPDDLAAIDRGVHPLLPGPETEAGLHPAWRHRRTGAGPAAGGPRRR